MDVYISAWASALLVLGKMGNARASDRWTSDRYRFPRFFVYTGEPQQKQSDLGEYRGCKPTHGEGKSCTVMGLDTFNICA